MVTARNTKQVLPFPQSLSPKPGIWTIMLIGLGIVGIIMRRNKHLQKVVS